MKPLLCAAALVVFLAPARAAYLDSNRAVSAESQTNGRGSYPLFAWAGTGDRMTTVGRWIWDCGHGNPDPEGACSSTASQACALDSDCASPACVGCIAGETCVGTVFNYHSELHPPQAVAVSRPGAGHAFSRRRKGGRLATRTDVWITAGGGGAGDRCVVTHHANPLDP